MSLAHSPPRLARRPAAETRERLLEHGAELFNSQGYNTTGINAIVQAAGVPKGSFYHYFASKQDFGLAVIDRFDAHYRNKLGAALDAPDTPPLDRGWNRCSAAGPRVSPPAWTKPASGATSPRQPRLASLPSFCCRAGRAH